MWQYLLFGINDNHSFDGRNANIIFINIEGLFSFLDTKFPT